MIYTKVVMFALVACALAKPPELHLEKRDPDFKPTRMSKVMTFAHALKNHKHPEKSAVGKEAVEHFKLHGELPEVMIKKVTAMAADVMSPSSAAQADSEWTAEDNDAVAGEGKGHDLEEDVGGAVYQGDMVPGDDEQMAVFKGEKRTASAVSKYGSFGAGKPWTGKKLSYCFKPGTAQAVHDAVAHAIGQFKAAVPCISWEDVGYKSGDTCNVSPAVIITSDNSGCWSYVGELSRSAQGFNLQSPGCDSVGTTIHEFLHALGQAHEQARPDRETYVSINYDKISSGKSHNFDIDSYGDQNRAYDMLSLMHYSATAFSTDGSNTIDIKTPAYDLYTSNPEEYHKYKLGNRLGMTQLDANQLADQYSCAASTLIDDGPCTDKPKADGSPWADSYGQDCELYASLSQGCSQYTAGSYCCACGGGLQLQTWQPSNTPFPPSPPPPPPPPSPPPPSALKNKASDSTCYSWKEYGYCESSSIYYSYVTGQCASTCAGEATDKYSSCSYYASIGYCHYSFSTGEPLMTACAKSCGGGKKALHTKGHAEAKTLQPEHKVTLKEGKIVLPKQAKVPNPPVKDKRA